jgi:3-oxoacyl-[acyl-carrier protein] reductase
MKEQVLQDKVAIVTESSKGIGAGIAKGLALAGAKVTVNFSSDEAGAQKTVFRFEIARNGGQAIAVKANIANRSDVQHLFVETAKEFGRVDVLMNNAGISSFGPLVP